MPQLKNIALAHLLGKVPTLHEFQLLTIKAILIQMATRKNVTNYKIIRVNVKGLVQNASGEMLLTLLQEGYITV